MAKRGLKIMLMAFSKKFLFGAYGPFLSRNDAPLYLYNSGTALRIFLKFCTLKVTNNYMKIILLMVFPKKQCVEQIDNFGPKNGTSS